MEEKIYHWHKVADSVLAINFSDNGTAEVNIGGKTICMVWHKDQLMACAQQCPHAGSRLVNGYIDALGNIVCPVHGYRFCLKKGRNVSGEGYFLKIFPVEIRSEGIFVGLEEK